MVLSMIRINSLRSHRPALLSEMPRRFKYFVVVLNLLLFVLLSWPLLNIVPAVASAETSKSVLVLYTTGIVTPGIFNFDQKLRTTFKASPNERITIYTEYLDINFIQQASYLQ